MYDTDFIDEVLYGCARCGNTHENILFKKFNFPVQPTGVLYEYTHWATCPVTGEPILFAIVPKKL